MLKVGEASATGRAVLRRVRGSQLIFLIYALVLIGGCTAAGWFAWRLVPWIGGAAGYFVGVVAYVLSCRHVAVARYRRRFASRGMPLELRLRLEVTPEALVYEIGAIRNIVGWSAVTELFAKKNYWIFIAQGSALFAPKRFFASSEAEKAFLAAALARMNEAARVRSPDAVKFIEAGAAS